MLQIATASVDLREQWHKHRKAIRLKFEMAALKAPPQIAVDCPRKKHSVNSVHNPPQVYRLPQVPVPFIHTSFPCSLALTPPPSISYASVIKLADIKKKTAAYYDVTVEDLISKQRTKPILRPRMVACYLAKTLTSHSLPEIGRHLGGRDHTTILHAVNAIQTRMQNDSTLRADIECLITALSFKIEI